MNRKVQTTIEIPLSCPDFPSHSLSSTTRLRHCSHWSLDPEMLASQSQNVAVIVRSVSGIRFLLNKLLRSFRAQIIISMPSYVSIKHTIKIRDRLVADASPFHYRCTSCEVSRYQITSIAVVCSIYHVCILDKTSGTRSVGHTPCLE